MSNNSLEQKYSEQTYIDDGSKPSNQKFLLQDDLLKLLKKYGVEL